MPNDPGLTYRGRAGRTIQFMTMTNPITTLRKRLDLSVAQCADYLGMSSHTIIKYENGTRKPNGALLRLIDVLQAIEVMAPSIHAHLMPVKAPNSPVEPGLPTD